MINSISQKLWLFISLIVASSTMGQGTLTLVDGARINVLSGSGLVLQNLNISPGSTLSNRGELTVSGGLANNAGTPGLLLLSDADGYGSLIHNTPMVAATVQQYLSSERWHLVTSPVITTDIQPYFDIYLKEWSETEQQWTYLVQPVTQPMNPLQGYSVWASDDLTGETTVVFEGELFSGNSTFNSLTFTQETEKEGFNLVGNPYPSPIEWNLDWTLQNVGGWAMVYDNGVFKGWNPWLPEGFQSYNGKSDGMIAPSQGFWVRTTGNNPQMIAPQSARIHHLQPFLKTVVENDIKHVMLRASANGHTDESGILFLPEATTGFDALYELDKLMNVAEAPNLYSLGPGNRPLAVNTLPEDWIETSGIPVIPIAYLPGSTTGCSITVLGLESLDPDTPVFLEDLKEEVTVNLRMEPNYDFVVSADDDPARFLLYFSQPAGIDQLSEPGIEIYSSGNLVRIGVPAGVTGVASVYNLFGVRVAEFKLTGELTEKALPGDCYYIVTVYTGSRFAVQKVFIMD